MVHKSLCYFSAYLDNNDSGRYFYLIRIGKMRGYGQLGIDQHGRPSYLDIISLRLGDSFSARGKVVFAELSDLDITLDINSMDVSALLNEIAVKKNNASVIGFVEGRLRIDGKVNMPRLKGRLQSRDLKIGSQDYNFAFVDLRGTWPLLFIEDGRLFYEGGSYGLGGCIDLASLPKSSAWKDVTLQADQKNIHWMNWDIAKGGSGINEMSFGADGLNVERESKNDNIKISLKTFMNNEATTKRLNSDALELEYKMNNGKNIKMRLRHGDGFLGLEHRLKF